MNLFDVYPLFDIAIDRGKGCKVWDETGQEYLDLYGGHAVISIGHCHPHYIDMMTRQLNKLGFIATQSLTLCSNNSHSVWVKHVDMRTIVCFSSIQVLKLTKMP